MVKVCLFMQRTYRVLFKFHEIVFYKEIINSAVKVFSVDYWQGG